jgi:cell division protein FtsZ
MTGSGVAIMGSAMASGEHRAIKAVTAALSSPLLNDNDIRGAKNILLNITSGTEEVLMGEVEEITRYVQDQTGEGTDIIWGNCYDDSIGENISVTLIATGFATGQPKKANEAPEKVVVQLDDKPVESVKPVRTDDPALKEENVEPNQFTFNFDLKEAKKRVAPAVNEVRRKPAAPPPAEPATQPDRDKERKEALRRLSRPLSDTHLSELESVPAYKRKDVKLNDVPASDENEMSSYSVHEDEEGHGEVRKNNSFLHGHVD